MPYADNNGVRIHYEVESEGPPLILVHGFLGSLNDWRRFGYVDRLKDHYQLVLIDARAHGASGKPHAISDYGRSLMASDVLAVMDSASIDRAHYWGYSMGGTIAFGLAKLAPDRFESMIVGAATHEAPPNATRMAEGLATGIEAFVTALEARGPLPPPTRAAFLANDAEALSACILALAQDNAPGNPEDFAMSCLAYAGEDDEGCARFLEMSTRMPHASFVALPGLNHITGLLRSDIVLPHVTAFLAKVAI